MPSFAPISPSAFYGAFLDVTSSHDRALSEARTHCPEFTRVMLSDIFPEIASRLGLCCYAHEYYTLDAIFYVEADSKHFGKGTWAKYISVALEHENTPKWSVCEVNKLQILNAPLKVLITYPRNREHASELLGQYAEIIADADPFEDIGTLRRQLVIFGFKEDILQWEAYAYAGRSFTPVEPERLQMAPQTA